MPSGPASSRMTLLIWEERPFAMCSARFVKGAFQVLECLPLFSRILFQKGVKHLQRGWDIDFLKHEAGRARTINR